MSEPEGKAPKTTIRAAVTEDEHTAVKRAAKWRGLTIDEFVRTAVDGQLRASTGKSLATLAGEAAKRPKLVQMELFG